MKKTVLMSLVAAGLFVNALSAVAANKDDEFPAAYFEPKVVYIDKDAAKEASTSMKKKHKVVFDPKYPAAYFEPKVIYP